MKYSIIITLLIIVFFESSCKKTEDYIGGSPNIIWKKSLPIEMQGKFPISNPIVYGDYLIFAAGKDSKNDASFYKLNKNGEFVDKWDVNTNHYLIGAEKYIYNNQLVYNTRFFDVKDEKIVSIDLNTMTTNWEIPFETSRSGLSGLGNKIYVTRYYPDGLHFYDLNLDTKEINQVYQVAPVNYGALVEAQEPCYYKINNQNTGILVTSSDSTGFVLINYNITSQQLIWRVCLTEFNNYAFQIEYPSDASPIQIQLDSSNIVINSNNYISVREFKNGKLKWTKSRMASFNVGQPLAYEGVIISLTDKMFCYNTENGNVKWSREPRQDAINWGSGAELLICNKYLFFKVPIELETGKAHWLKFDNWNSLDIEFSGIPGIDKKNNSLYYVNNNTYNLYKVAMPE